MNITRRSSRRRTAAADPERPPWAVLLLLAVAMLLIAICFPIVMHAVELAGAAAVLDYLVQVGEALC